MDRKTAARGLILAFAGAMWASCGSGDVASGGSASSGGGGNVPGSGGSGGSSNTSYDQACARLVAAAYQTWITCSPILAEAIYGDAATAVERLGPVCVSAVTLPGYALQPADLEACAQAYETITCDAIWAGQTVTACLDKPGGLADSAPCGVDEQCQSTYCKVASSSSACGVCAPRNPLGGTCQEARECQPGLVCGFGASPACVPLGAAGATCDAGHPCGNRLYCSNGICAARLGAGAACTAVDQCDMILGLTCNTDAGVCQLYEVAGTGESCGPLALCSALGYCAGATTTTAGTCLAPAPVGAACDSTNGPSCQLGADCVNGLCAGPAYADCR